jgi:hypothetical protein
VPAETPPIDLNEALAHAAKQQCWRIGSLAYLRHEGQQQIRDAIEASPEREHFALCSRRYGKSYEAVLGDIEFCLKHPNSRALYLAPWAKDAALIAGDTATVLLADCPPDLRPEYRAVDKEFLFKNGSIYRLKGVNGEHARYLRGGTYHRVSLDEAGQMDNLGEVVHSVVMPMTLTTQGKILYLTTPPDSPGHDSVQIYTKLHERGAVSVFTLRDAPHIPHVEKCRILVDIGERLEEVEDILAGKKEPRTNYAQREFFCRFVVDTNRAVVPEFLEHKSEIVVDEYKRPPVFDAYGAADMGMRDRTGILAAYLDFTNQRIVVEGELLLNRANTAAVAASWGALEAELQLNGRKVMRVVDDPSLRVSADLTALGLTAMPVVKPGREAAVAAMRVAITSGRIRILSRCKQLIHQLETAIYKKSESGKSYDFERDAEGHFDLVDALIYLVRSVVWTKNPYPPGWVPEDFQATSSGFRTASVKTVSRLNQAVFGGTSAGRRLLRGKR